MASARHAGPVPFTLVSFHAHPDDEALLTGGTLARVTSEGHRVVLVTATDGAAGLASSVLAPDLARRRREELETAAADLGVARVVLLGHPDGRFADAGVDGPAEELAAVLREESADVLTGYDEHGGYGHPDHVHVHRVARRARALARTPVLLEASVDRTWLLRADRVLRWVPGMPRLEPQRGGRVYLARTELTHRVDVREQVPAKTSALLAHHSQTTGGPRLRTVSVLGRLPRPEARQVLGHEWFREVDRPAGGELLDDVFASLR